MMRGVTAVVLGGGRGTRLYPLTIERAKPALSFLGKYRLIDIPISNCINSGINRIFVLTQFMSASLHRHIMQTYKFDAFTDGFVDILAAEQTPMRSDWFQGTADAVRATLKHTTYYKFDQMLILSGDHLYRMDYANLIAHHRSTKADITIAVYPVAGEEAHRLGLLKVNDRGAVTEFAEKPQDPDVVESFMTPSAFLEQYGGRSQGRRCLASMGIYVFEPEVLLKALGDTNQKDFGKAIINSAIKKFRVMAYPFTGYWRDIGTITSFFEANLQLAAENPPFKLYEPRCPIYTSSAPLPPCRVIRSEIRDSLVVDGSDLTGAAIINSVVGARSVVREGSRLKDVVMLGADFFEGEQVLTQWENTGEDLPALGIGRGCKIERTIIDRNVRIGDNVIIEPKPNVKEFRGKDYWIRDGVTIIPSGAIIASGTHI